LSKESGADAFQVKSVSETRFLHRLGQLSEGDVDKIAKAVSMCIGVP
jgi:mRNA-degrading endonuclease toxin of MazEF toxin-antitoxin module